MLLHSFTCSGRTMDCTVFRPSSQDTMPTFSHPNVSMRLRIWSVLPVEFAPNKAIFVVSLKPLLIRCASHSPYTLTAASCQALFSGQHLTHSDPSWSPLSGQSYCGCGWSCPKSRCCVGPQSIHSILPLPAQKCISIPQGHLSPSRGRSLLAIGALALAVEAVGHRQHARPDIALVGSSTPQLLRRPLQAATPRRTHQVALVELAERSSELNANLGANVVALLIRQPLDAHEVT